MKSDKAPLDARLSDTTLSLGRRQSIMVLAGDVSGDQHVAKVLAQLMKRLPNLEIWGVGGEELDKLGAELLYRCEELAVVGILAVAKKLPLVARMRSRLLFEIAQRRPDCILLVDYGGFNIAFAKAVRAAHPQIPIVYFISPQVWGSRPWRLKSMAASVSKALVIFPFEEEIYRKRGIDAQFVGHPLVDKFAGFDKLRARDAFLKKCGFSPNKPVVGIFPGSRAGEVCDFLPVLIQAISWLHKERPGVQFAISKTNQLLGEVILDGLERHKAMSLCGETLKLVPSEDNAGLMAASDVLWTKSGTTTLEAAMLNKPMLVFYRGDWLSFLVFLLFKRVKYIALPNLLAGRLLVPELIQLDCRAELLVRYTRDWLDVPAARADIIEQLRTIKAYLAKGDFAGNAAAELEKILSAPRPKGEKKNA